MLTRADVKTGKDFETGIELLKLAAEIVPSANAKAEAELNKFRTTEYCKVSTLERAIQQIKEELLMECDGSECSELCWHIRANTIIEREFGGLFHGPSSDTVTDSGAVTEDSNSDVRHEVKQSNCTSVAAPPFTHGPSSDTVTDSGAVTDNHSRNSLTGATVAVPPSSLRSFKNVGRVFTDKAANYGEKIWEKYVGSESNKAMITKQQLASLLETAFGEGQQNIMDKKKFVRVEK